MLAGREADLHELLDVVAAAARRGHGGLTLIGGEPGIGKTRLAGEVADRLTEDGFASAWVSCREDTGAPPYWPWSRLLGQLGRADALSVDCADPDPELARFLLFEAVIAALSAVAADAPLLLVLDDLHWMDEPSLQLLAALRSQLAGTAIVVLGTFRDTEPGGERLPGLLSPHRQLVLGGLSPDELGAALVDVTGERLDDRLTGALHRRTGGNPYFAAEVVRLLRAEGRLAGYVDAMPLPDTVRAVLERRLARLPSPVHELLRTAALIGDAARIPLLAEVAGLPAAEVAGLVQAAVRARLLTSAGADHGFAHPLVREALVGQLGPTDRLRLHLRIGRLLVERMDVGGTAPPDAAAQLDAGRAEPAEAARHLLAAAELGGPAGEAVGCARAAAAVAMQRTAYEDAVALLQAALAVADTSTEGRGEVLCELGEAAMAAGDRVRAREAYLAAAATARRGGQADLLAVAALGLTGGADGFEIDLLDPDRVAVLSEALRVVPEADSAVRAALLARLSSALAFTGAERGRRELAEAALAMARRLADPSVLTGALAAYCDAMSGPDHAADRRSASTEIIAGAAAVGDRPGELLGRRLRLVAMAEAGEWPAVDMEIDGYARLADRLGQPRLTWFVPLWRGARALMRGDADAAARFAEEHAALVPGAGSPNAELLGSVQRFVHLVGVGRADEAYPEAADIMAMTANEPSVLGCSLAFLHAHCGRVEEARRQLDQVLTGAELPMDSEWLPAVTQLAVASVLADHRDAAELAYRSLAPYGGMFVIEGIMAGSWGSVDAHLGRLARFLGRSDQARAHFTAALELDAAAGSALAERTRRWASVDAPPRTAPVVGRLCRDGEIWTLVFAGRTARLADAKGVRDLAVLLARPDEQIHVAELVGGAVGRSDPEPLADRRAIAAYRRRLDELADELAGAESGHDLARAERARLEREALVAELGAVTRLGGRPRTASGDSERMRKAVSNRIRQAVGRIGGVHPELGRHLRVSILTGTYCGYRPEYPVRWQLS